MESFMCISYRSHFYKEELQKILRTDDISERKKKFKRWVDYTENCGIIQFEKCTDTYRRWLTEILASMDTNVTNGFTEGCNNKICILVGTLGVKRCHKIKLFFRKILFYVIILYGRFSLID